MGTAADSVLKYAAALCAFRLLVAMHAHARQAGLMPGCSRNRTRRKADRMLCSPSSRTGEACGRVQNGCCARRRSVGMGLHVRGQRCH